MGSVRLPERGHVTRVFVKPATTVDQQLRLLRQRGMVIDDESTARHYLHHIAYYRLRAYWLPFEIPTPDGEHALKPGTRFEDVLELYIFDRRFRLLMLDAIERIEVSVRSIWTHHLATTYGSHGYLEPALYGRPDHYQKALTGLREEIDRSQDTFIKHYKKTYHSPETPPIWMAAELLSLGQLSKWVSNLRHRADRLAISKQYGLDEKIFSSLLHHLTYVRNICAHHRRLWNKQFTVTMTVPKYPPDVQAAVQGADTRRIYNTLVMLGQLLPKIAPGTHWTQAVIQLIQDHPVVQRSAMGFPPDWQDRKFWKQHFS